MERVHLIAVGGFGAAVAERLVKTRDALELTVAEETSWPVATSSAWPRAAMRILLAWRESPALAEVLDARSADWGTPWLPVVMEHPRLRVGPVVVPGAGPCYRCFGMRRAQHENDRAVAEALLAHYDADAASGPQGFLPHQVTVAAALAESVLRRFDEGTLDRIAGRVHHYHLLEQQPSSAQVVAVHGCDRCGRREDVADSTWSSLAEDVQRLLELSGGH